MKVSLVIPCLNEEKNIKPLAEKIQKAFSKKFSYEVIWVDDGSTDKTPDVMREVVKKYKEHKCVILMRCVGQSTALMAGFDKAEGDYIATLDGDIQNDPDEIPKMLKKLEKEKLEMVVGWREKRWKNNVFRRVPSLVANCIIRKSFRHIDVHDAGCPVKICKAHILKDIRIYGELHRFLTYVVGDMGANIGEIKIHHRERKNGHSKYGVGRTLKVLMDILNLKFLTMRKTTPIQMMGPVILILYFLGFVSFVWMIYEKFAKGVGMSNTPLLVLSVMFVLMATMFLVMGLVAELVVRSYFEGSKKKSYFVREVVV